MKATLRVNGEEVSREIEPRLLLVDFLRHELGLTGTHVGCEQGVCGMCTVLLDGDPIKSCLMLDAENFKGCLQLCSDAFQYKIVAHSPEIGKDMVWLAQDHGGMKTLFGMLPQHVKMQGKFRRHVSVYSIEKVDDNHAKVVSSLMLAFTDNEGASKLFLVGQYNDVVGIENTVPRLVEREVRLETRSIAPGMHIPV